MLYDYNIIFFHHICSYENGDYTKNKAKDKHNIK